MRSFFCGIALAAAMSSCALAQPRRLAQQKDPRPFGGACKCFSRVPKTAERRTTAVCASRRPGGQRLTFAASLDQQRELAHASGATGKGAGSSRTARSRLQLVHRRVRHARFEGGEGVARRAGVMRPIKPPPNTKVANSKFKNGARFGRAVREFLDRRGRPFAILSL